MWHGAGGGYAQFAIEYRHRFVCGDEVFDGPPLRLRRDGPAQRHDARCELKSHVRRGWAEGADEGSQRIRDGVVVGDYRSLP